MHLEMFYCLINTTKQLFHLKKKKKSILSSQ